MKRYSGNFKKFWGTVENNFWEVLKTINKYKIISIEMKRYLEIFYSLFMHDG